MNTQYIHKDIKRIIDAFEFVSDTSYSMDGLFRDIEKIQIMDPSRTLSKEPASDANKQKYINVLLTDIYNNFYHADKGLDNPVTAYKNGDFIMDLSQANQGTGTWEEGWIFVQKEPQSGKVIVQKNGMNFWMEDLRVKLLQDNSCLVKVEKENRFGNDYFYYAFGNTNKRDVANYSHQPLRFYWNLTPDGAIRYMEAVTQELNEKGIVFTTKVLSNPESYKRTDSGVLYVDAGQLEAILPSVKSISEALSGYLKQSVPMFTKQLFPGVGFAEDPRNGMSFGISRSKIIAESLYACLEQGKKEKKDIENVLIQSFEASGILPSEPYVYQNQLTTYQIALNQLN